MNVNKGTKVGILIEAIALIIMVLLVLMNKAIPSMLSWCFTLGLAIALTGAFIDIKTSTKKSPPGLSKRD